MKTDKNGIIRGYFRPKSGADDLQGGITALVEAGVASGNLFFEQEGTAELERLLGLLEKGDTIVVLRLRDICRNIGELFGLVRRLLLQGVVLKSVGEPWFRLSGDMMQDAALYELICHLYDLSCCLEAEVSTAVPAVRKPVGRPRGIRADYRKKLESALKLYTERGELSVAEICGTVGLNQRTFYRYLDQQGFRVVHRPKGRKAKQSARTS